MRVVRSSGAYLQALRKNRLSTYFAMYMSNLFGSNELINGPENRCSPGKSTLDFLCSAPTFDIEPEKTGILMIPVSGVGEVSVFCCICLVLKNVQFSVVIIMSVTEPRRCVPPARC